MHAHDAKDDSASLSAGPASATADAPRAALEDDSLAIATAPTGGSAQTARARRAPAAGRQPRQLPALLRNLDLVLLALAVAPAIVLGVPAFGLAVGAGGWVLQRIVQRADRGWITRARQPRAVLGFNIAEAFARIWLLAGAIILAGVVGGKHDGLAAAVTIFCAYSVAFLIRVLSGPPAAGRAS